MHVLVRFGLGLGLASLVAHGAGAATLNVVSGELVGANQVDVGGTLYNVAFVDDTCINLFSGCDEASDFTFTTFADAGTASQALLDQVFLDVTEGDFDTDPVLTIGCNLAPPFFNENECSAFTPYGVSGSDFQTRAARNRDPPNVDFVTSGTLPASQDFGDQAIRVFAVWTPVPEPTTALLLAAGLAGLAASGKRRLP